jgi:transcriptional regulator with XRE-family HTH domain
MALKRRKLIEAREKAHLSQEELAEELDTTRVTISHWENVVTTPYPHHKRKLCARFGIDIDILLAITEETAEVPPGEAGSCILSQEAPQEETKTDESLPTNTSTALTLVRGCVWQPPASTIQNYIVSNPVRLFWQIAHTDYDILDDMTTAVQAAVKDMTMTTGDDITRRDVLCELASIPLISLGKTQTLKATHYEETLRFCTAAIEGCWELYRGSDPVGAQHAFECCCTYVPLLETIAHDSLKLRKGALNLAAQYAIIKTMLGWHFLKRTESIGHAVNALGLSKESGDILLQMVARCKLSYTYITAKNYAKALETMQEGEHILKEYQCRKNGPVVPLGMIGNFYSGYSIAQAYNGIDPDATLGIATSSAPLDRRIAFSEFTISEQAIEAAWTYSTKGDTEQAMIWLKKLVDPDTLAPRVSTQSEYERHETLNILTGALLQAEEKDMEHIVCAWTKTMEWIQAHQKEVLYDGAMANLAIMRSLWPREDAIRRLMPLTSHW